MIKYLKTKLENFILKIVKNYVDKKFAEHNNRLSENERDILTLFKTINVGVDVGFKSRSWAVICLDGKPEIVYFLDLGREDSKDVRNFLRRYKKSNLTIDEPPGYFFRNELKYF